MKNFTHVDKSASVTRAKVMQYRRLVKVGQVSHIFNFLELGRIHLLNRILLNRLFLQ